MQLHQIASLQAEGNPRELFWFFLDASGKTSEGLRVERDGRLRLDWDTVQRIVERALERGLARRELEGLKHLGLDEKSFRRGQDYISVRTEVGSERRQASQRSAKGA